MDIKNMYENTVKLIKELGVEGLRKALPNLTVPQKKVLASILNELKLQKSVSVEEEYNPKKETQPVVDLEVETQRVMPTEEEEDILVSETANHNSQGDKTPEELTSNVAKSIDWSGKNLFSTAGKFHVESEEILFAPVEETLEKSDSDLSPLEQMLVKGEDKSWVQIQQEKMTKRLQAAKMSKTTTSFSDEDLFSALNLSQEDAQKLLGE